MNGHFISICLAAAVVPWSSISAQLGKPAPRQPTAPPPQVVLPDITSVVLYISPILLPGSIPGDPNLPSGVQGGREAEGRVTLRANAPASGAVIALLSGNTSLLRVPATVTVPAGANSVNFRYDLLPVSEPTTATVSAVYNKLSKTGSVLILPPSIEAVTLDSVSVQGGKGPNGLVTLNGLGPPDRDIRVALTSSHPAVAVPIELLLRGVQQKSFQIKTKAVGQPTAVVIAATLSGNKREASLTVVPATLRTFGWYQIQGNGTYWYDSNQCHPAGQSGNYSYSGTIPLAAGLNGPAPSEGGAAITIASSNPELLPAPANLIFAPNATSTATLLTCPSPDIESDVTLTGTYLGVSKTYVVRVKRLILPDLAVRAVLYDAAGNVIAQPTNPQPFRLCAAVVWGDAPTVTGTMVLSAYQHSRGFSRQTEVFVSQGYAAPCQTIEGLEIGEYVDITVTVDPANGTAESNENNNVHTVRVSR